MTQKEEDDFTVEVIVEMATDPDVYTPDDVFERILLSGIRAWPKRVIEGVRDLLINARPELVEKLNKALAKGVFI